MRIIQNNGGELIKGVKTPIRYSSEELAEFFDYHLSIWLTDWQETTSPTRYDYRYFVSVRIVSLDLLSREVKERVILARKDEENPADHWGMVCDSLTGGYSSVLWQSEGDDKALLLRQASTEVRSIPRESCLNPHWFKRIVSEMRGT